MNQEKRNGIALCLIIAIASWGVGKYFPVVGGAVIAIVVGMIIRQILPSTDRYQAGIIFSSKKVLHWAVILLGFGMDLGVILRTGKESLPIICATIGTSLLLAYGIRHLFHIPWKIATLVGVGSSICGGSAIAATAPVIEADDEEVAQAIAVIFFYNVLAAILFPLLGQVLGFDTLSGRGFGIFAGTAINDTSSVTAAASTWDSMWNLGTATLDKAVTVKLTRTLAIIPITLVLGIVKAKRDTQKQEAHFSLKNVFPMFIVYFMGAAVITTVAVGHGISPSFFAPFKTLSKFLIVWAMAAIGLRTDIVKLVKTGGKPLLLGGCCWMGITLVSLLLQHCLGIW